MVRGPKDISWEEFVKRFGFDPFAVDDEGAPLGPGATAGDNMAPYVEGGADQPIGVPPPQGPESFPTPQLQEPQLPLNQGAPGQDLLPPQPPQEASLGPPSPANKSTMRRLVQREFIGKLAAMVGAEPDKRFRDEYYARLDQDPSFKEKMILLLQDTSDGRLQDDIRGSNEPPPIEDQQSHVMASNDPERQNALKVGSTASTDLSRMADLIDEATGKADGLNSRFRVDLVSLTGLARHKILQPLTDSGDLDGASKFDTLLDAFESDIEGLAGQGYHPNAVPLRVALQFRFELDKNPELSENTGFGQALRQMRGLLKRELEDKVARSSGLTGSVAPQEWQEAAGAYDEALNIAKSTEPPTYRRR